MGEKPAAPSPTETASVDPEETTLADTDWPVAAQYRVTPEPLAADIGNERGEVTLGPTQRYRPSALAAVVAAILVLLILASTAAALLFTRDNDAANVTAPPPTALAASTTRSVPRVLGLTLEEAREVLDLRGLRATVSGGSRVDSARVTSQDPPAGTQVRRGTSVSLVVARSETTPSVSTSEPPAPVNEIAVPGVVGLPVSEAAPKMRAAGFRVDIRLTSSSRAAGIVLAQSPDAGAKLERGSRVELEVAKKIARPTQVRMPSLIGSSAGDAKGRLRELGLHWSVVDVASTEPEGTVLRQSPAAGTELEKGETVTLRVSSGPALLTVPGVIGLDEQRASAELQNAGFDVTVVDQPTTDPVEDGTVLEQDPAGGTKAEKGIVVTITVARWTEPGG